MRFRDIPQFIPGGNYHVDVPWGHLEHWLEGHSEHGGGGVDLDPDFQRGHVWDDNKRRAYIEFMLRGGNSSYDLHWNCPGWPTSAAPLVIVDGKQRLEAVRKFMRDDLPVFVGLDGIGKDRSPSFPGYIFSDFEDKLGVNIRFRMHVNNLETRAEVLTWYLQMNSGGVVHTDDELARVRHLLQKELGEV